MITVREFVEKLAIPCILVECFLDFERYYIREACRMMVCHQLLPFSLTNHSNSSDITERNKHVDSI